MNKKIKIVLILFFNIVVVSTLLLYTCFSPLFKALPQPTGYYAVGSLNTCIIDTVVLYDDNRNEFGLEIFYPRETFSNNPSTIYSYHPEKIAVLKKIKAQDSYIPYWMWNTILAGMTTYTQPNAPINLDIHHAPVIIYLPGISGEDLHNTYLEQLASNGYIVCAIAPPGDIIVTLLSNNKIVPLDDTFKDAIKKRDVQAIYTYRNKVHVRWNNYLQCTLKELQKFNNDPQSLLYQKMDFNRLGLIGHSQGGAVITDFCLKHTDCKAAVNLDGWTKTYNASDPINVPYLFLLSQNGQMPEMNEFFTNNTRETFKKIIVDGAGHSAFNDYILLKWPFVKFFGIVTRFNVDTLSMHTYIKNIITNFFDSYLKK